MMLTNCPNCQAEWGILELQFQECFGCGFPNITDQENEYDPENEDPEFDDNNEDY